MWGLTLTPFTCSSPSVTTAIPFSSSTCWMKSTPDVWEMWEIANSILGLKWREPVEAKWWRQKLLECFEHEMTDTWRCENIQGWNFPLKYEPQQGAKLWSNVEPKLKHSYDIKSQRKHKICILPTRGFTYRLCPLQFVSSVSSFVWVNAFMDCLFH